MDNSRRLAEGSETAESPIQVFAVKEVVDDAYEMTEMNEAIIAGWDLVSLDSEGFELQLNFTSPLQVSAGEEPDLLLI